ncbi:helix-turn-helix domain-containing protein [Weissella hellenica]|uniref:helix-turn-helix domain-containing protein n=1 Tax=Weissella hellenica TaxID=46256 RepID=UPI003889835C
MNEERNTTIGQELQQARLDKGLSLDDIQQSTKIQKRYLAAIESGQFDQLPGAFYERAFVRQYAAAVGLDAVAFMKKYENESETPAEPDLSAARVDADNVTRTGMHQPEETVADKTRSMMPKIIIGVVVVAIIAIIWAVVSSFAGSAKEESREQSTVSVTTSQVVEKSATNASKTTASSVKSDAGSSKTAASKSSSEKKSAKADKVDLGNGEVNGAAVNYGSVKVPNKAVKMQLKAVDGSSWMQVSDATGKVIWNGTVENNDTQEVEIPQTATGVVVSIGNALATEVSLNNQKVDLQSQNASVWRLGMSFTR